MCRREVEIRRVVCRGGKLGRRVRMSGKLVVGSGLSSGCVSGLDMDGSVRVAIIG